MDAGEVEAAATAAETILYTLWQRAGARLHQVKGFAISSGSVFGLGHLGSLLIFGLRVQSKVPWAL